MRPGKTAVVLVVGFLFASSVWGAPANWAVWVPTSARYTHSAGGSFGDFWGGPYNTAGIDHWYWYYCWYGHLCTDQPAFKHYEIRGDYYDCEGNLLEKDAVYWGQTWTVVGGTGTVFNGGIGGGPGSRACFAQETKTPAIDCRVYVDMSPVKRPGWSCDTWPSFPEPSASPGKNLGRPRTCELRVGNPINVATGNKYEEVPDIEVFTPAIPLEFKRSYNSQSFYDGPLGFGWTHTYNIWLEEIVIENEPARRVVIWDHDGRALYFDEIRQEPDSGEIPFAGESGVKDRLKQIEATGEYILDRTQGNLTYRFDPEGRLNAIGDPHGNQLTLSYAEGRLSQVSNNFGKTLFFDYNEQGRIQSVTDPKGQSVSYSYLDGGLVTVTYPDGHSVGYDYSDHNLTDKYDTEFKLIGHWEYDDKDKVTTYYSHLKDGIEQGRIDLDYQFLKTEVVHFSGVTTYTIQIIDGIYLVREIEGCSSCESTNKRFDYSSRLDLVAVTSVADGKEITTQYSHDDPTIPWEQVGEVVERKEAVGWPTERTTRYSYSHHPANPLLVTQKVETSPSVVTPGENKVSLHTYDDQGNLISTEETGYVLVGGVPTQKTYTTEYEYNTLGQLILIDGPRTDVSDSTNFEYYANITAEGENQGQLKAIVNSLGHRAEFSDYDANGNVGRITDPNGVITSYTYDQRNRITTITNQTTGAVTHYFYDSHGNLSTLILPEGNQIVYTYDLADRLTDIEDSLGNALHYEYDTEGNRIREEIRDPGGVLRKHLNFEYDPQNRLKKIINPDGTYTEYGYDGNGNRVLMRDPNANTTTYVYDALNRLTQVTQPETIVTSYSYDRHDNLASVTDATGNTTHYTYDDFSRLTETVSPDTGTTTYVYDEAGNLIEKTDAKGITINYTYDSLNRLTAINFPDSSENITYTYDGPEVGYGRGRLTGMADPSGTYTYSYDPQGNLIKEEKKIGEVTYTTQYGYNQNNTLESITYPSGRMVTYRLDEAGRVLSVAATLNGGSKTLASNLEYLPYGGITALTYGNGLALEQGHDLQYRIASIQAGLAINRTYGHDPNGNITSITDGLDSSKSQNLGYDALNRLVSATGVYGQISYSYDPVGNRTSQAVDDKTETYTYGPGTNRLTQIKGEAVTTFSYDPNGNTVSENGLIYLYNQSNRLVRVSENGTILADSVYNGAGRRVKKTTPAETRILHYDLSGHLIAETDEKGKTLIEYVYLGDQPLALIGEGDLGGGGNDPGGDGSGGCFVTQAAQRIFGRLFRDARANDTVEAANYFHNDHLGTPQVLTDGRGLVVWKADYRPFGEAEILVEEVENPFRFPGQYFDQETGLHYNYFRDYHPGVGRYIEPDPIGLRGGINIYAYVRNNPIILFDSAGLADVGMAWWENWPPDPSQNWMSPGPDLRGPDYFSLNINVAIPTPWTGTLFGWSGHVALDKYGNLYWAPAGGNVGKALTFISGNLTAGWVNVCGEPSEQRLKKFLSRHSLNIGGGYWAGAGFTWIPGAGTATEVGFVTPQIGVSYQYSFQEGNLGLRW